MKKLLHLTAALLLLWAGSHLAAMAGIPLIGQSLLSAGVQTAIAQVAPGKPAQHSQAGTWGLQMHVASVQPTQRAGAPWNGSNDGFAVRYAFNDTYALQLGHYRNEHTVQGFNFFTNYAYIDYTPLHYGPLRLGAFGGPVSGFDDHTASGGKITSFAEVGTALKGGLVARYQWSRYNAILRANSALPHAGPASLAAEVGFSFK